MVSFKNLIYIGGSFPMPKKWDSGPTQGLHLKVPPKGHTKASWVPLLWHVFTNNYINALLLSFLWTLYFFTPYAPRGFKLRYLSFFTWGWSVCANMSKSGVNRKYSSSFPVLFSFFLFFQQLRLTFWIFVFSAVAMVIPGNFALIF